nr:hypothetical protein [Pseudoprimorskyibacter insulae]
MRKRKLHRLHVLDVDPTPYGVRMAARLPIRAFLLMENNGAGLVGQAKGFFDAGNRILKIFGRGVRIFGRVQRQGKQMLFALCAATDGMAFLKRAQQIICRKAAYVMHGNALILILQKMPRQVPRPAALIANEDHGTRSVLRPSAMIKSARIAAILTQAILMASAVGASIWTTPFSIAQSN